MAKDIGAGLGGKKKHESQKARVNRHEQEIADELGGERQPASGALDHAKGDIKLERFLLNSKKTIHKSIKIDGVDLNKICRKASEIGRHPALFLTLVTADLTPGEWVCLPATVFADMVSRGQDDI